MASHLAPSQPENYLTLMTILNHPLSRGGVHISSPDVRAKPTWDPQYNSNDLNLQILARGVQFAERLVERTTPLGKLLKPSGKRIPALVGADIDQAEEIMRQRQISIYHMAGSCAMLPRGEGGVVDGELMVYGTENVRVVDASEFPLEVEGNIQGVVYAVAERAADLIKGVLCVWGGGGREGPLRGRMRTCKSKWEPPG